MFNLTKETMKKLMLAVCLLFGGATLVSAQRTDQSTTPSQSQSSQDQDRQQISISQLPDAVTAKLESQDYSGWTIGNAYKKMDDAQGKGEIYIVELKKGTETKKVKFDKDGNELTGDQNELNDNQGQPHDQGQPEDNDKQ